MEIADTVTGSLNGRFELEQIKSLKILNNWQIGGEVLDGAKLDTIASKQYSAKSKSFVRDRSIFMGWGLLVEIRAGSGGSAITQGKKKGNIYVGALAIFVIEDFIKVSSDK